MLNININIQNYWVFGLCPSSGILKTIEHKVLETGCFHPQVRGGNIYLTGISFVWGQK
jgi:hypothetical protein